MKKLFYLNFAFLLTILFAGSSCTEQEEFGPQQISNDYTNQKGAKIPKKKNPNSNSSPSLTIHVASYNWNNDNITCPGEELELHVFEGTPPYTWEIQGANISSPQGLEELWVNVHQYGGGQEDVFVFFKVTDATGRYGVLSGYADAQLCNALSMCETFPDLSICGGQGKGGSDGWGGNGGPQ